MYMYCIVGISYRVQYVSAEFIVNENVNSMRHNEVCARAACNARCYMYRSAHETRHTQGILNSVSHATPCTKAPADTRLSMAVHC